MNNFKKDLAFSLSDRGLDAFYKEVFPHIARIEIVNDLKRQRLGIDKILHLKCGKQIFIDEKIRRKDYGDILLEEFSVFENRQIGWLSQDKYTDYIVYCFEKSQKVYFFPFLLLQKVWLKNYQNWLQKYKRQFAKNKGYTTTFIAVPIKALLTALNNYEYFREFGLR